MCCSRSLLLVSVACIVALPATGQGQIRVTTFTGPEKVAPGETASGQVVLADRVEAALPLTVQWRDSFGRIGGATQVTVPAGTDRVDYALAVNDPIVRRATLEVLAGNQIVRAKELAIVFPPKRWDDYYAFVWANYPGGRLYDTLRQHGINGAMVYRDNAGEPVKQAGFEFYVDQMCWEVYAWYHKVRYDWNAVKEAYAADPRTYYPTWRRECLHQEGTYTLVEQNYSKIVAQHRDDHPMFYNLADEIGLGDQSGAMDFCWSAEARDGWIAFLKAHYGTLDALSRQWGMPLKTWGQARAMQPTTYRQYGRLWREVYLPKSFRSADAPEVRQQFKSTFKSFDSIVDLYMALVTSKPVDAKYVQDWIRGVNPDAAPAGSAGEEVSPQVQQRAISWVNSTYGSQFTSLQDIVDFYNGFEKWYGTLTIDNAQPDAQEMAGWNLSQWADFREYMDQTFADAIARGVEIGRKYDPAGRFGFTGTHHPGVFSGQNYAKLCQVVGLIVPYNIGNSPEIIRSLYPDSCYQITPSWFSGNRGIWDIWTRLLDGDRGIIFWDNDEPKNRFLEQPSGTPTERATSLGPTLRTIESGLAKLLYACRYDNSGIAIYYSQPSIRVAWWRQYLPLGRKWVELQSWNLYNDSWRNQLRDGWCRLLEDCNVQYDFVSHEQVEIEDRLGSGEYKVLILPEVFALSDIEAARIRDFVAAGGIVIADNSPGVMDEHGKWRDEPALVDLWDNQQGFLLNKSFMAYSRLRLRPGQERELRSHVEKILFDVAQIRPTVRVMGADGQPLTAAEVHTYHAGPGVRVVGIGRSPSKRLEGPDRDQYKDMSALEKPENVTLLLDRASQVYDVLAGRPLGQGDKFEMRLDPYTPIILTLSDEELPVLTVKSEKAGDNAVDVLVTAEPASVIRVARTEVLSPDNQPVEHYSANMLVRGGFGWQRIPFALNDAKGKWTVRLKDVATGHVQEVAVER